MRALNQYGFTLLELVVTLVIISSLAMLSLPTYNHYLINTRRAHAQIALLNLAASIERYSIIYSTYAEINLTKLEINEFLEGNYYKLEIANSTPSTYLIRAIPQNAQLNDIKCGILSLNQLGEKTISGKGSVKECWGS